MRLIQGLLFCLVCLPVWGDVLAKPATQVKDIRLWTAPDHTRLVLDLSAPVEHKVFRLSNPERVVVDLSNAALTASLTSLDLPDPVIDRIRHGELPSGQLRIVVDVREQVRIKSFLLKSMHDKPHRLVIDLLRSSKSEKVAITVEDRKNSVLIAVDPGHGGEDPGAVGPRGLKEKDVTLRVARELVSAINKKPHMQAMLTRNGDYYVKLTQRVKLARKAGADLFISIHADAVKSRNVSGASVYTMSEKGATDKVARLLADKENSSDAIGGAMPDEVTDPLVQSILADLSKRDSMNNALILADDILQEFEGVVPVKYRAPKRARFVVLGATEIPSVLIELDYISNPRREALLKDRKHQKKLASSIMHASERYLARQGLIEMPRANTHVVQRGESLWSIAKLYGLSMARLSSSNGLKPSSMLKIGDKLRLPRS